MKRLLLILAIVLATVCQAFGALVLKDSYTTSGNDMWSLRYDTSYQLQAIQFQASSSYAVKEAHVWQKKVGSPTGNIKASIYSDNGDGRPDANLGDSNNNDVSALTTSFTERTYTFSTPVSLTNGVLYWIVLSGDYTISTSNYTQHQQTTAQTGWYVDVWNGSIWNQMADARGFHALYSDEYPLSGNMFQLF
jgi:hypothetical protein